MVDMGGNCRCHINNIFTIFEKPAEKNKVKWTSKFGNFKKGTSVITLFLCCCLILRL